MIRRAKIQQFRRQIEEIGNGQKKGRLVEPAELKGIGGLSEYPKTFEKLFRHKKSSDHCISGEAETAKSILELEKAVSDEMIDCTSHVHNRHGTRLSIMKTCITYAIILTQAAKDVTV